MRRPRTWARRMVPVWVALALTCLGQPRQHAYGQGAPSITMPQLLRPLEPEYPSAGKGDASVVLRVTLDKEGTVTKVEVDSGDEPYASAAIRAAEGAEFSPALRDGQPIPAMIRVVVEFTFSAPEPPPPASEVEVAPPTEGKPSGAPPASTAEAPAPPAEPEVIDVKVSGARVDDTERSINKAEARLMAGTFGDPVRAVELLPGITPLISSVPYFFVRGAPPGSVNFYIDEARVPQLYHVGPGSSILHPQLVQGVSLRSGPYRARYGDATSGVITTQLVTDVYDFGVEAEAKLFESSAFVGTPLADRATSVAVAGKVSHLGPVLEVTNPELRLNYWDYQALVSHRPSPRDQLSVLVFGAGDFVGEEEDGVVDINIDTLVHRARFGYNRNLAPGIDLQTYLIAGMEQSRFHDQDEEFRARSLGGGTVLTHVIDESLEWATGLSTDATDFDASGASNFQGDASNIAVSRTDTQAAAWVEGRISPARRVSIDGGVRGAFYKSRAETAVVAEPRLVSTLTWSESWKSILSVGYSTQAPSFTVPSPAVRPAELTGGLQKSLQRSAALRYAIPTVFTAETTFFFNTYQDLSDPLALSTVADPLEIGDSADGTEPPREDLNFDERPDGRSVGVELLMRRPFSNRLSGTLSYTLSRSTRRLAGRDVPSSFDRTHLVNATGGYDLGAGYNFSTRLLVYSGLPVRRLGDTGGRTGDRSDAFVRVDFRVSKEWRMPWGSLMLIAEMLNAAFQEETLGVSCAPAGCVTAKFGPVTVPSVGLRGTFGSAAGDTGDRELGE